MSQWASIRYRSAQFFVILAVALTTSWALALIRQSQEYVPTSLPEPDTSDLDAQRSRLIARSVQSLLEQFYATLMVPISRLDPTGRETPQYNEVVVVLYPRAQAPRALEDTLVRFVESGGRLVVFTDTDLNLLSRFGIDSSSPVPENLPVKVASATVEVMHVSNIRARVERTFRGRSVPLVPLLTYGGNIVAGITGRGEGTLTVIGMRLADYNWIETDDNALFLANLLLSRAPPSPTLAPVSSQTAEGARVRVLDFDAEILRDLYALDSIAEQRRREATSKWKYDSLWSLIKANPVSAGLIQIALAFLAFCVARGRRLGAPLPDSLMLQGLPDGLQARARLYERHNTIQLSATRAALYNHRCLTRLLGLEGSAPREAIRTRLQEVSPTALRGYDALLEQISQICHRGAGNEGAASLVKVWKRIDLTQAELRRCLEGSDRDP